MRMYFYHPLGAEVQIFNTDDPITAEVIAVARSGEICEVTGSYQWVKVEGLRPFRIVPIRYGEVEGWVNRKWLRSRR